MTGNLITIDSEGVLLETINLCRKINLPLRCLHLCFSMVVDKPSNWQGQTIAAVIGAIEDVEAITYVCADGDMFVVSRAATSKTLLRVLGVIPKELVPVPSLF